LELQLTFWHYENATYCRISFRCHLFPGINGSRWELLHSPGVNLLLPHEIQQQEMIIAGASLETVVEQRLCCAVAHLHGRRIAKQRPMKPPCLAGLAVRQHAGGHWPRRSETAPSHDVARELRLRGSLCKVLCRLACVFGFSGETRDDDMVISQIPGWHYCMQMLQSQGQLGNLVEANIRGAR
jgi:hypothetical protein